jgi:hypothetical protein
MGEEPLIGEAEDDEETRIKTDPEPSQPPTEVATYPEVTLRTPAPEPAFEIELMPDAPTAADEQVIEDDEQPGPGAIQLGPQPARPLPPLSRGTPGEGLLAPRTTQKTLIGTEAPPRSPRRAPPPPPPARRRNRAVAAPAPDTAAGSDLVVAIPEAPVVEKGAPEPAAAALELTAQPIPQLAPPRQPVGDPAMLRRRAAGLGSPLLAPPATLRIGPRTMLAVALLAAALIAGLWLWLSH